MNKSLYDTCNYKTLVLSNGLKVTLVHDKNATISGVSLTVSVGSFDETIEGTAHFLEHLLFMGSTKYPDENKYASFINENGGSTNAYTANTYTNYLFDINSDKLIEALDIFSQMFISSLLNESAVERELQAINSEFTNYCNHDGWRANEVFKCIANPNHPFKKFSVGNATSLNIENIVNHVKNLYESKYSANLMNLCIVSNIEFDNLETHVKTMFEQIPNKNYTINKNYPPFCTSLQKTIYMIPIKNQHKMNLTWQIQMCDEFDNYKYKPLSFLSNIFGHEGKGSIFSKLKLLNWASSLSAGTSQQCFTYTLFSIDIILTDEGIQNIEGILNIIYNYIELGVSKLSNYDECKLLYNDIKNTNKLTWTFLPQQKPLDHAINIASVMQQYDFLNLNELNFAPYFFADFDENAHKLILNFLSYFSQKNSILCLQSKQFESKQFCFSVEEWYRVMYTVIDSDVLEFPITFNGLNLPHLNQFIPNNLEPVVNSNEEMEFPQQVVDTTSIKVFTKKTNKYNLPHAFSMFNFDIDGYSTNVDVHIKTNLLSNVVMSQINDVLYDSLLLDYSAFFSGDCIYMSGYYEKLPKLLSIIIDVITSCDLDEAVFNLVKEQFEKQYSNEKYANSSHLILNVLSENINKFHMKTVDKINVLNSINFSDLCEFTKKLKFNNCVALFEGNVNNEFIKCMVNQIEKLNFVGVDNYIKNEFIAPATNSDFVISKISDNPQEQNDCIMVNYYYGKTHFHTNPEGIKLDLLARLTDLFVGEPFFDELRTKQQLGYTVGSYCGKLGKCFERISTQIYLIQSPNTHCDELLKRIDIFINEFSEKVKTIDIATFETYVNALEVKISKPFNNLTSEASFDMTAILEKYNLFNYKSLAIEILKTLKKEDFTNFFLEHYVNNVKRYVVKIVKYTN